MERILFSTFKYYGGFPGNGLNLGDSIQTLAAMQFLPRVDYFVEREYMMLAAGMPKSFLIANGWYMHNPYYFPPPPNLIPFYISVHIEDEKIFTPKAIRHFQMHEPIGCRDPHTLKLMKKYGINAYYSGCLTLTFQKKHASVSGPILFVDLTPAILEQFPSELRHRALCFTHGIPFLQAKLDWRHKIVSSCRHKPYWAAAIKTLIEARQKYRSTRQFPVKDGQTQCMLDYANNAISLFSCASLVITTRLHCALPCLAMGIPVRLVSFKETDLRHCTVLEEEKFVIREDQLNALDFDRLWPIPDVSAQALFLRLLCEKAVAIQGNPLKYEPIEKFYQESGWAGAFKN